MQRFLEFPHRETKFPQEVWQTILNGPHIYVGNPLFKCPRNPCLSNGDWDLLNLKELPVEYCPRVKYFPTDGKFEEYRKRTQLVPWFDEEEKRFIDFYRLAYREMVDVTCERTLLPAILPPKVGHVNNVNSIVFKSTEDLILFAGAFLSLPTDNFVRLQNKEHLLPSLIEGISIPTFAESMKPKVFLRVLALNCLASNYSNLWNECWDEVYLQDGWSSSSPVLNNSFFSGLTKEWSRNCSLREDLMRRQALLELDVLTAQAYGFDVEDLILIYKNSFSVMKKYEAGTFYDQNGRIVFTPNTGGLTGAGLPSSTKKYDEDKYPVKFAVNGNVKESGLCFDDVKEMKSGKVSKTFYDDTLPDGKQQRTIEYEAPFFKMDREADYRKAWAFFEEKKEK